MTRPILICNRFKALVALELQADMTAATQARISVQLFFEETKSSRRETNAFESGPHRPALEEKPQYGMQHFLREKAVLALVLSGSANSFPLLAYEFKEHVGPFETNVL